jgi:hypothetical protein
LEPLRHEPLGGILVEVEWGRHNLSLELTNYWRGRRLRGRLLTDDATVLPRVYAMLSASLPRHLDELIDLEIPASAPPGPAETGQGRVDPTPDGPLPWQPSPGPALHPDVALLVATLVRKGLLTPDDLDTTRRMMAETPGSRGPSVSPLAARLPNLLDANEPPGSTAVRLIPRK